MAKDIWTDRNVQLRAPRPSDIEVHLGLPYSREIHTMYGGDPEVPPTPSRERSEGWYAWLCDHPFARVIEVEGRVAGEIRLHSHDPETRSARLAVGLFAEADLGRGYGRCAIQQTLSSGFDLLRLEAIDLRVLAFNTRAIRCYTACGFETVARLPRSLKLGDVWHDDLLMEITAARFHALLAQAT
ncbi:GNAT family N-acetyltransferase [Gymnodinialimonas ulvae]|uniref:GNAT family N-acetyltransferase n=1 Tax=Gymnodinialimonas ulvae TaxID=3126504 RepID=UPI0030980719